MGLEGKLTDMPLLDLLRIFQRGARNGKLALWDENEWALLWIKAGQVVNAIVLSMPDRRPLQAGEHAIFHLFTWTDGHFRYSPDDASDGYAITIRQSTAELIAEALRRRRLAALPPPVGDLTLWTPLCPVPQGASANEFVKLSVEEWNVLVRIGQQTTAKAIASQTGMPAGRVLEVVSQLIDCGLVIPVTLADLPQRRLTVSPADYAHLASGSEAPISNLTRAIRRRLQQIAVGA